MKHKAIQKITKGELVVMPGIFIDDIFSDSEVDKYVKNGFATQVKPKTKKKVKDGNRKNT